MTAIEKLAKFAANADTGSVRADDIARVKHAFLDTIGCMLLGADVPVTHKAIAAGKAWGGGPAPVYGGTARLSLPFAAMANGVSAHAYDLDDYTLVANDHASAVLVPAILAAAERAETSQSGRDLLDAYVVGLEVIMRIGQAVNLGHYNLGWHTTSTIDGFGATAAVCRLWGLDQDRMAMALSLTTSMGSGYVSQFGTDGKPIHAGLSAKSGLVAAGLAEAGMTGYLGALDGAVSFKSLLCPNGEAHFDKALSAIGAPWGIEAFGLGAKVYPSCGYTHRTVDCSVDLHKKLGISSPDEIVSATACVPDFHRAILPFGVPKDRTEALFSIPYCAAVGLVTGNNRIEDFLEDAVADPAIRDLASRIEVLSRNPARPEINLDANDPDTLEVVLKDGRREKTSVGLWTGAPGRDLSATQFEQKFRDCLNLSRVPSDPDRLLEAIDGLDRANSLEGLRGALLNWN